MYNIHTTETHNHQSSAVADARLSEKSLLAIAWFEQFAKVASDNLPHLQQWSLPRAFNKKEVYKKYVAANGGSENSSSQLNYAWFLTLWRKRYPWIKIASVSTPNYSISLLHIELSQADRSVGRCGVCGQLKHQKQCYVARGMVKKAEEIDLAIELHNSHQMGEQKEDVRRKSLVSADPTKYMHIYADGMDTNKTQVVDGLSSVMQSFNSEICQGVSSSEGCKVIKDMPYKVDVSVFGVMIHDSELNLFPWMKYYASDSNIAITCILLAFERYRRQRLKSEHLLH